MKAGFTGHRPTCKYRARVEDSDGDRWAVVGTLNFLSRHCATQSLRIIWIKPTKEV